jgi:hypothetical protein
MKAWLTLAIIFVPSLLAGGLFGWLALLTKDGESTKWLPAIGVGTGVFAIATVAMALVVVAVKFIWICITRN